MNIASKTTRNNLYSSNISRDVGSLGTSVFWQVFFSSGKYSHRVRVGFFFERKLSNLCSKKKYWRIFYATAKYYGINQRCEMRYRGSVSRKLTPVGLFFGDVQLIESSYRLLDEYAIGWNGNNVETFFHVLPIRGIKRIRIWRWKMDYTSVIQSVLIRWTLVNIFACIFILAVTSIFFARVP